ncbi:hypothetical protein [Actinokineospora pegani]|uniref:hypothetical protein n=1 Tax=Actinokineospora pegani TaxID=2654637 RepID=UPI0012E9F2DA|nr:hypothetical protein [Actinokineospora pegani]
MKLYAEEPGRRTRQAVADLVVVLLIALAALLAREVRDRVLELRGPGNGLITAGNDLHNTFADAAGKANGIPLVGDDVAGALNTGSSAADQLTAAGQWQVEAVEGLALWVTIALVALPTTLVLIVWLPRRFRYVREASAAARLRSCGSEGHDLLALRALVTSSLPRLARTEGLATGWRAADPDAVAALAATELRRLGLDP